MNKTQSKPQAKVQSSPTKQEGSHQKPDNMGVYTCKAVSKGGWTAGKYKNL